LAATCTWRLTLRPDPSNGYMAGSQYASRRPPPTSGAVWKQPQMPAAVGNGKRLWLRTIKHTPVNGYTNFIAIVVCVSETSC